MKRLIIKAQLAALVFAALAVAVAVHGTPTADAGEPPPLTDYDRIVAMIDCGDSFWNVHCGYDYDHQIIVERRDVVTCHEVPGAAVVCVVEPVFPDCDLNPCFGFPESGA